MSTPKKPATDLAALKARLAKKSNAGGGAPPPVPPSSGVPPVPPMPPMNPMSAPPSAPPMARHQPDLAPPMAPPSSMPMSEPRGGLSTEDPFGGVGGGGFDPSAGLLDSGGEVAARGNFGVTAFFVAIGIAFGTGVGWIGHKIVEKRELVSRGKAKGEEMANGVKAISEARATISLAMEGIAQKIASDPAAAAQEIESLLKDKFDSQERIDSLFGWQLASVHANGVKSTFNLYDEANRLKTDLGYLGAFLASQPQALQAGSGPNTFAVEFKGDGVQMVAVSEYLCGDSPAKATSCEDPDKAVALNVIDNFGSEPRMLPIGTGSGQGQLVKKDGAIYTYAVGMEPQKNAVIFRDALLKRIAEHLEAMGKAEKTAQRALSNYAENPNVDGPAPDPGIE